MIPYLNSLMCDKYEYDDFILDKINRLLTCYIQKHSKVLVVRFDLHFPQGYGVIHSNQYISETIAYIVKKYKRQDLDPMYLWVMEQSKSPHCHYHVVLLLDGQKVRSYQHVFKNVEEAWGRALGVDVAGCVHHCNVTGGRVDMLRNGLQIRRCDGTEAMEQQIHAVYNQVSYLAKKDTKLFENDGLRNFGMSRISANY